MRSAAGTSAARKTRGLRPNRTARSESLKGALEIPPEIHAGVERRDLVAVAVEHLRLVALEEARQPLLGRLAPARMVDRRVHVGVEPVLVRRLQLPGVHRLFLDEPDL